MTHRAVRFPPLGGCREGFRRLFTPTVSAGSPAEDPAMHDFLSSPLERGRVWPVRLQGCVTPVHAEGHTPPPLSRGEPHEANAFLTSRGQWKEGEVSGT
jgi:hypothetical protein